MKLRAALGVVAVCTCVVAAACSNKGGTVTGPDQTTTTTSTPASPLTAAQAAELAGHLVSSAYVALQQALQSHGLRASTSGDSALPTLVRPLVIFNFPIDNRESCGPGGRIENTGSIQGSIDDNGTGILQYQIRQTWTDCNAPLSNGKTLFINGDPYLTQSGSITFLNGVPATLNTGSLTGGLKITILPDNVTVPLCQNAINYNFPAWASPSFNQSGSQACGVLISGGIITLPPPLGPITPPTTTTTTVPTTTTTTVPATTTTTVPATTTTTSTVPTTTTTTSTIRTTTTTSSTTSTTTSSVPTLTILSWKDSFNIQLSGSQYHTTGTIDLTVNVGITGTYRAQLNAYPFLTGTNTFANALSLHFTIDQFSSACPDLHNTIPLYLLNASGSIVASVNTTHTGTGCAFQ